MPEKNLSRNPNQLNVTMKGIVAIKCDNVLSRIIWIKKRAIHLVFHFARDTNSRSLT